MRHFIATGNSNINYDYMTSYHRRCHKDLIRIYLEIFKCYCNMARKWRSREEKNRHFSWTRIVVVAPEGILEYEERFEYFIMNLGEECHSLPSVGGMEMFVFEQNLRKNLQSSLHVEIYQGALDLFKHSSKFCWWNVNLKQVEYTMSSSPRNYRREERGNFPH